MIKRISYLTNLVAVMLFIGVSAFASELDPSFGVDGRIAIEIGSHGDRAHALAIQSDGKILLGGSSADGSTLSFSLIRLLPDGSPDSSFNGDGTVLIDLGRGDDEILALGVTPEGDILAGGYSYNGSNRDFALLRFKADGSLDTTFGNQGKVLTAVGNNNDEITALAVDAEGAVLVAGSAEGTNGRVIVLGRYLADGSLDEQFSDQGLSLTGIGNDVLAQGLAVNEDGRVIVSGSYTDGEVTRMVLVGFTADGLLDPEFGTNGVATTHYTREVSEGYGIFQEEDGSLFIAGSIGPEGERAAALFRFTAEGVPDSSFGEDGVLVTDVGPEDDVLFSLAGNEQGLNASGFTTVNGSRDFLLVAYERGGGQPSYQEPPPSLLGESYGMVYIGELQVSDSFEEYINFDENALLPAVMTTSFGIGDSVSYALAMQGDGKAVTVGTAGDSDMTSMVVARYGKTSEVKVEAEKIKSIGNSVFVTTTPPSDVTATGASTGGYINPGLGIVDQRGVVFSIAPYPVCNANCASGVVDDGGNPPSGDDTGDGTGAPVISNPSPTGVIATTTTTLSVTTNVNATCKYGSIGGVDYDSIQNLFADTGDTSHSQSISGLADGQSYTYFVRCENNATGDVDTIDYQISFTVDVSAVTSSERKFDRAGAILAGATIKIGDFLVPSANAQDATTGDTTGTTTSDTSTASKGTATLVKEGYTIDGGGSGPYGSILEGLTPDTKYYLRAYAKVGNTVYYGDQIVFETASACFIATAAYGSILHPAVGVLRDFRDRYLQTNNFGRQVVAWYYTHSPSVADKIAASDGFRLITRLALVPVIFISWLLLHLKVTVMLMLLLCGAALSIHRRQEKTARLIRIEETVS